jgi:hypothetical protein
MSIDAALAPFLAALEANTAAKNRNNDLLERVVAGQALAIEKIEPAKTAKSTKTKDTPAAGAAPTPEPEKAVETITEAADTVVSDADVKAAAVAWMDGKSKEDRLEASKKLTAALAFFGVGGKLTGEESKLDDDQRKQAKFFIERWAAGLTVDFNTDYDFDGEPTQDAGGEDPLG